MKIEGKRKLLIYVIKFTCVYVIFYYGTLAIIGLSVKGGFYSEFVHNHLDYISILRKSLLNSSNLFCRLFHYNTYIKGDNILTVTSGISVRMVYSCLGYGVMSFWIALVAANKGTVIKKLVWIIVGCLLIYIINVLRVSLLLISIIEKKSIPFHFDHHILFNIIAYIFIILLIYLYDRSLAKSITPHPNQ